MLCMFFCILTFLVLITTTFLIKGSKCTLTSQGKICLNLSISKRGQSQTVLGIKSPMVLLSGAPTSLLKYALSCQDFVQYFHSCTSDLLKSSHLMLTLFRYICFYCFKKHVNDVNGSGQKEKRWTSNLQESRYLGLDYELQYTWQYSDPTACNMYCARAISHQPILFTYNNSINV